MKVRFSLLIAIATISCFCTDIYAQNQPLDNIVITDADKIRAIEEAERTRERSTRSTTYFTTTIETDASQTAGDGSILVVCIGQSVTFTATSSCQGDTTYILEADSLTYEWTIISGRFDTIVVPNAGSQISHTFSTSGNFLVKCKAYNASDDTNTNNNTLTILVSSRPPLEANANFDTVCSGYEITLTGIAHQPQEQNQENTLVSCNYSDSTQFLPDGCNLSFNMDVHTPDSFAIINSTSEIDHFYMNIEHSYFGDLNIMLECPNGQKCMLHSRSTNTSSLPAMDWTLTGGIRLEGSKGGMNHFLGMAIDLTTTSSPCLETPGTGWTYRIYPDGTIPFGHSSPTTTYYSYLSDPCNDEHATVQIVDTAPRNGKYGPYESMTSLIGCPINGTWSLHIKDEWSLDNGYLFDWGIVMNNSINEWSYMNTSTSSPSSSPSSYTLGDFSWSGNGIDSVYTENGITTATAIPTVATGGNQEYTFSCTDNLGCSYDTTINIYVGRAIETPEIDMVVTDSLSHNTITWTAIDNDEIQEYRIYRSSDSTNYDLAASIPASEPTLWTDETTDFSIHPYWYCITAAGECETRMSPPKESMYFTTDIETDVPQTTSDGINYANICNGQSITFTATNTFHGNATYEQNDENLTYDWIIVTGNYDTIVMYDAGRQISRTFDTSDGFRIKCQSHDIYNVVNSNDYTIDVQVSVRPQIEATTSQDSICSGSEITLTCTVNPEKWQSQMPVVGSYSSTDLIDGSYYGLTSIFSTEIHAQDSLAILNSTDDIDHVYINLEHSDFADLSIMLECPNGQKCLLHAYSHYTSQTPMDWTLTGGIHLAGSSSAGSNTMVGISPDPMYVSDPCYLTPGEGWTYRIYPNGTEPWGTNSHYHSITFTDSCGTEYTKWAIDTLPSSSTRQYGPYESMTSLIGCPIDGTWKLYINDKFRDDNGYLFEWGIRMYEASDEWSYMNTYENSNLSWNGNGIATDTTDNGTAIAIPSSTTTGLQEYTFSCTDNFGCSYDTTINVYVYRTTPIPEIKSVSTNVLNQNVVEFVPDNDEHITQYNIYRGTDNDDYEFAATLPPYTTIWTDMIADPTLQPYSYIVTSNDNCGESEMTSHHRTMRLNLEAGQNGNQTLSWTHYEGFQYDTYKIYRGANPFAMEQIGEVPSDQNSFTDNNSDRSYCYYQIQTANANNTDIVAKSNIVGTILSSIEGYVSNLSIFPNPATTTLNISSSESIASIEIFSSTGQSVLQTNVNGDSTICDIKHLASGIYLIVAHDSNAKIGLAKFTKE